ncbi:hypothetical protein ACWEKT_00485 [Nocardia takedensis]
MNQPHHQPAPASGNPSTDGRPSESPSLEEDSIQRQAADLAHEVAGELALAGPPGWQRLEAFFAITVAGGVAYTHYRDEDDRVTRLGPAGEIIDLVRRLRELSARLGDGPWWRMVVRLDAGGELDVDYDYGDEPFPDDQLLTPEAYSTDLRAFPRERIPVWLAAYIGHDNRQWRTPHQAQARARADREAGVVAQPCTTDFPALPVLWARWATIAAAFVAVGSDWGPRILPALGVFEGASRSGATLYVLPDGRAVLSGGVWNAPELDAAYNGGAPMPDLYAGAPAWVANQVLNSRAARGLLSFCYWWERDSWFRGESAPAEALTAAVPGVWSARTTADVLCGVVSAAPSERQRAAADDLVAAAESGVVSRATVAALFDDPADDVDGALYQLSMAGVVLELSEELPREEAILAVREHILGLGLDTDDYPVEELVAERLNVGWMVFAPTRPGEIVIGRALFYIADDGVIEQSTSSTAPSRYAEGFAQRFRDRKARDTADFR